MYAICVSTCYLLSYHAHLFPKAMIIPLLHLLEKRIQEFNTSPAQNGIELYWSLSIILLLVSSWLGGAAFVAPVSLREHVFFASWTGPIPRHNRLGSDRALRAIPLCALSGEGRQCRWSSRHSTRKTRNFT